MVPETSLHRSFSLTDIFRVKDLRRKLIVTGVVVLVFQFLTHIPLPGLDLSTYQKLASSSTGAGTLLLLLNLFSGGGLARLSVLAVGLNAYIAAEAFMKVLIPIIPGLERIAREGPREFENSIQPRLISLLMLPLSVWLGYSIIRVTSGVCWEQKALPAFGLNINPLYTITVFAILIGGAYLARWLADLIDSDGLNGGSGVDILLLAGILAGLPGDVLALFTGKGPGWAALIVYLALLACGVYAMVLFSKAKRDIPVEFPGRRMGRMSMPVRSVLPLRLVTGTDGMKAGQSFINLALLIANPMLCSGSPAARQVATWLYTSLAPGSLAVLLILVCVTIPFTYFYAMVKMGQENYSENLKWARRSPVLFAAHLPGDTLKG